MRFKLFILFLALGAANVSAQDLNSFYQIFEACRSEPINKKVHLFSREIVAYRLGSILEEHSDPDINTSITIARNVLNTCMEPKTIDRYYLDTNEQKPRLNILYNNETKVISLTFKQENSLWVIGHIYQGKNKVNQ